MNEKLKKFNYLRILVTSIFIVLVPVFGFLILVKTFGKGIFELEFFKFLLLILIFSIIYLIIYSILNFISIIWHEIGHLIFGINAKLKFVSFNVLSYTFTFENNKLKIKKETKIPGIKGYCNMKTEENKQYNKKSIKLYCMGGIIFHFVSIIITIILMSVNDNIYLNYIYILNIIINMYYALYNSIPAINKSGTNTDALHLIYYIEDQDYLNTISKLQTLQSLIAKGCDLKDIDAKLFCMPEKFKTNSDVKNAMIYVDYLSSKDQYKEASEYAKKILEEAKEILSKQDIISLKLQFMNCIFYGGYNLNEIAKIWDEDIQEYLDLMGKAEPVFIGFNYMHATLIEKSESNSKKYLNQFQQLNKKIYDKNRIEETEQLINDVKKKMENLKN